MILSTSWFIYLWPVATSSFLCSNSFSINSLSLIMDSFRLRSLRTFSKAVCSTVCSICSFYSISDEILCSLKSFRYLDTMKFIYCSVRKFGNYVALGIHFYCIYFYFYFYFYPCLYDYLSACLGWASLLLTDSSAFCESDDSLLLSLFSSLRIHVSPSSLTSYPNCSEKFNNLTRSFYIFYNTLFKGFNDWYLY